MAKGNLPRIDDAPVKQEQPTLQPVARTEVAAEAIGHLNRAVYADLKPMSVRVKFKQISRWLDDTGAKLSDGKPVGDKKNRVVLWLIENTDVV